MMELPKIDKSKVDDIHYNFNKILSYNKPFNAVISPREPGKTTNAWLWLYRKFLEGGYTAAVIRRIQADITDTYIPDIENGLNKFLFEPIKLVYKRSSISSGTIDVMIKHNQDDDKNAVLFFRIIALSIPMLRLKGQVIPKLHCILFDEFIIDKYHGEKYINDETFKYRELYNTLQRSNDGTIPLRALFLGNPYSKVNPYFIWWNVDYKALKPGSIQVGSNWIIECAVLTEELKQYILKKNPLYEFDDSYTKYAFNGESINDANIILQPIMPKYYKLYFIFMLNGHKLLVFLNTNWLPSEPYYHCVIDDNYSTTKDGTIMVFEYKDLTNGTYLYGNSGKVFDRLCKAFQYRKITYQNIQAYDLMEQVYSLL